MIDACRCLFKTATAFLARLQNMLAVPLRFDNPWFVSAYHGKFLCMLQEQAHELLPVRAVHQLATRPLALHLLKLKPKLF